MATRFYIERSAGVLKHYQLLGNYLRAYYQSLAAGLKANAPDLISILAPPKPPQHGYQDLTYDNCRPAVISKAAGGAIGRVQLAVDRSVD